MVKHAVADTLLMDSHRHEITQQRK